MEVDFDTIADALGRAGIMGNPAELHGMLCGRIAGGQVLDEEACLAAVAELFDAERGNIDAASSELVAVYRNAAGKFADTGFGFELLLPDDEVELSLRIDSLGQWCQGFLVGLGLSGLSSDTQFSADAADALKDVAHIAQIDVDAADSEDSETNLFELIEYVRMAALMIHADVVASRSETQPASPTLH